MGVDTFSTLMQGLPAPLIARAEELVDEKDATIADLNERIATIQANLDAVLPDENLYRETRNKARLAAISEIDDMVSQWDIDHPEDAPHEKEYGPDFPENDGLDTDKDLYDFKIKDKVGTVVYVGGPGNAVIDANKARIDLILQDRENLFFGTYKTVTALTTAISYMNAQKAAVEATAALYDSIY